MLKSRFRSFSGAFNANLVTAINEDFAHSRRRGFSLRKSYRPLDELYKEHDQSAETSLDDEENQLLKMVCVGYKLPAFASSASCFMFL